MGRLDFEVAAGTEMGDRRMTVDRISLSGAELWCGTTGSYRTRLFADRVDAVGEEKWLDDRWMLALSDARAGHPDDARLQLRGAHVLMRHFMNTARRGLRRLRAPLECPREIALFRSEGGGEPPRILATQSGTFIGEFRGDGYCDISGELWEAIHDGCNYP